MPGRLAPAATANNQSNCRHPLWLRAHGVTARKPIHELRKEFGSMVNRKHGLSAAGDQLRHSGIATTAAYYIDRPRKATSGLGALLETEREGEKDYRVRSE